MSRYLNAAQTRGLNKLGDVMLPGDPPDASRSADALPAFSDSGCARHFDRIAPFMPATDRADLLMLLGLLGHLPSPLARLFLWTLERQAGAFLRFMRLGLRGLVLTLYYSDPVVHEKLGFRVGVYTDDLKRSISQGRDTSLHG